MKKEEYLDLLEKRMNGFDLEFKSEILSDFNEHFEQGLLAGKSEEEIAKSLGDIQAFIDELKKEDFYQHKKSLVLTDEHIINCLSVQSGNADVELDYHNHDGISYELIDQFTKMNIHNYQVIETLQGNRMHLQVIQKKQPFFNFNSTGLILKIFIPNSMQEIKIESLSGDIQAKNLSAEQFLLSSASGDIVAYALNGDIKGDTFSGDLTFDACSSKSLILNSKSGDIVLNNIIAEKIKTDAVSGDISFSVKANCIVTSSISGDIELNVENLNSARIKSTSGDISLHLYSCTGLKALVKSLSGEFCFNLKEDYQFNNSVLNYKDESCALSIETLSGDIEIQD